MWYTVDTQIFDHLTDIKVGFRYALEFEASAYRNLLAAYHPVGVTGSYTVRGGRIERPITCVGRYLFVSEQLLREKITEDGDKFNNIPISITGPDSKVYKRCFLTSSKILRRPRYYTSVGRFADVQFDFMQYGDES